MPLLVCGSLRQGSHLSGVCALLEHLADSGFEVGVEAQFLRYLQMEGDCGSHGLHAVESVSRWCIENNGVVVSLGGDGTFLRTARLVGASGRPILGINTGHLGFLSAYTLDDASALAGALLAGRCTVEARTVLQVHCHGCACPAAPFALNEVALLKDETASMISVSAEVDGHYLAEYLADGLVVATATGSTAYNLSAGGPILAPELDNVVLTPLAPHSLTLRPLVLSGSSCLRFTSQSRSGRCRVSLDGNSFQIPSGAVVEVSRAPFCINVVRRDGDDFASVLRHKLHWGAR